MRCQAADPTKCRYHGNPNRTELISVNRQPSPSQLSQQVFKKPNITEPLWWNHKYSENEATLLDVIQSPEGDIAVIWEDKPKTKYSPLPDTEFKICVYRKMNDGTNLGSIKLNYTAEEAVSINASIVDDKLRGKGYGSALYLYTAKKLAETNQTLIPGLYQSYEAAEMWMKLKEHYPKHVISTSFRYNPRLKTAILDLRNLS